MLKFPIKFEAEAETKPGIRTPWKAQTKHLPPISCAIPPEFMGPGDGYSPEDLLSLAVQSCLLALFKVYCEKNKISFVETKSRAVLTMDRNPSENTLSITHIDLFIDVKGASDKEKAQKLLETAIKDCPVGNSLKSGKTFHLTVE